MIRWNRWLESERSYKGIIKSLTGIVVIDEKAFPIRLLCQVFYFILCCSTEINELKILNYSERTYWYYLPKGNRDDTSTRLDNSWENLVDKGFIRLFSISQKEDYTTFPPWTENLYIDASTTKIYKKNSNTINNLNIYNNLERFLKTATDTSSSDSISWQFVD